ncbi:AAA family ATPase [Micrococcus luteus]|uniref:AAA family ATPase n=1 Tax=Micrococcus luteus TaxID=1270 RepID=UPI0030188269
MSILRVHDGLFGLTFQQALDKASPGATIALTPGTYAEFESIPVGNLRIIGAGSRPEDVILVTQLDVHGQISVENLTLQAPHFHNAVRLHGPTASAVFLYTAIQPEPTGQFPAVYSEGGAVTVRRSTLDQGPGGCALYVEGQGTATFEDSTTGTVNAVASTVTTVDSTHGAFHLSAASKVHARGTLCLAPAEGMRGLVLTAFSVLKAERLTTDITYLELSLEDSALDVAEVSTSSDVDVHVMTSGGSHVQIPPDTVRVTDIDRQKAEQEVAERRQREEAAARRRAEEAAAEAAATGEAARQAAAEAQAEARRQEEAKPRAVMWTAAQGADFTTVQDQLRPGDTLVLEEGDFHLPDPAIMLNCHIRGTGRADRIRLHGAVGIPNGATVRLENMLLVTPSTGNAVNVHAGGNATLTGVLVDPTKAEVFSPLCSSGGRLTLNEVRVVSEPTSYLADVLGTQGGVIVAEDSTFGIVRLESSARATLTDCTANQLYVLGSGEALSLGTLRIPPTTPHLRALAVEEGGRGTIADLCVEEPCEVFVAGSLQIAHVSSAPHALHLITTDTALHSIPEDAIATAEEPSQTATADATLVEHPGENSTGDREPSAGRGHDGADLADTNCDPMAQLSALTGLADVKNQVQTFIAEVRFAEARRQRGFAVRRQTLHSQFLGNPGTGKTTVARLLGRALHQAGVLSSDVFVEVTREDLVSEHIGGTGPKTRRILESALGGILFIDEAYTLAEGGPQDFGREAIATLLAFMENHRDEFMVILAGYPEQMHAFFKANPGLRSRVPLRFDFEDYSTAELVQMGLAALADDGFTVDPDAYRRTVAEAHRSSGDRSNGRWVRNLNDRLVRHMAHRVMAESGAAEDMVGVEDERLTQVDPADLHALLGRSTEDDTGVDHLLVELDEMVGLETVKAWVRGLVAQAEADERLRDAGVDLPRPTYHMVFAGSPGTGKTTVARLVGKLFHRLGILSTPQVVEASRERMVGRYIGHTEERTGLLLDEARGGVLFVDEAYQLDMPDSSNDFGKVAVETLITRLEDDRHSFIAIFAGYTDRMAQFLSLNPGLASRVPHNIEFPDYSPDDIAEIVVRTLRRTWSFDETVLRSAVAQGYAGLPPESRANARQARNYADAISQAHKTWITESSTDGDDIRHIRDATIIGVLAAEPTGQDQ